MELVDIKKKLEESLENKDWEMVIELLSEIELVIDYIPPFDVSNDYEDEW